MKVLAVCLGNICRSPLAEGILISLCDKKGLDWEIDSAGTSDWHVGEPPCEGSVKIAYKNGIDISTYRGRQVQDSDFDYYDLILAMDTSNFNNLRKQSQSIAQEEKIKMILNFSYPGEFRSVPDSYYTGNYKEVFELLHASCVKLIEAYS